MSIFLHIQSNAGSCLKPVVHGTVGKADMLEASIVAANHM